MYNIVNNDGEIKINESNKKYDDKEMPLLPLLSLSLSLTPLSPYLYSEIRLHMKLFIVYNCTKSHVSALTLNAISINTISIGVILDQIIKI